jgi:hypothetical protein
MNLPPGYSCAECGHFSFCKGFFDCDPANKHCDWAPSRFVLRIPIPGTTEEGS